MFIKPLLLTALLFCFGANSPERKSLSTWVINGAGSLKVQGSTNINKFSCDITDFLNPDTLLLNKDFLQQTIKMSGSIQLDIKRFDCHNIVMTKDLRKALKAKDFPKMQIRFMSLGWYRESDETSKEVTGLVSISLAGVSKKFEVNYLVTQKGPRSMQLNGTRNVSFSDFNILPPGRFGGMVKTHNELKVEFTLRLAQL